MDHKTGKVADVNCFARDITKQYVYTQMIEKQNEQLKQIAWMQSHELRAPVANIIGLTSLVNETDPADPKNAEILSLVKEATLQLDVIVRRITAQTITIKDIEAGDNEAKD